MYSSNIQYITRMEASFQLRETCLIMHRIFKHRGGGGGGGGGEYSYQHRYFLHVGWCSNPGNVRGKNGPIGFRILPILVAFFHIQTNSANHEYYEGEFVVSY